jgi:uncharacterized protein (TIGR02246 family)
LTDGESAVRGVVDRFLSAVLARDAARAAALFDRQGVYHEARRGAVEGRPAIEAYFRTFFERETDWTFDVEAMIVEGPRAAVAYRFGKSGSDGRRAERNGCAIVETAAGSILRWREYEG